ncbi:ATP-binding protein [Arthrobacter crystallopoietes]|uniref:ATP-binding protein n=1 Tax=Crystallibacter crystallopoietes TaxID=37928 RepID=A0A1H1HX74_9MICC|nr:ATP-binding protein [Arthrobacter crystallopoietes]AUI53833.1 ATP-binding protein [Arthrobacter crystallopoietes]SDR30061.1 P-loop protein of unknown function [Arthrobacter crystallopoietes]
MTTSSLATIRPRERDSLLQSLRAGVVPRLGQQHVQVGRANEVQALLSDISRINDGGSGSRFIIGDYGSGKTFFLHVVRSIALQQKLVTIHADLSPDRRLHATGGQARSLYAELMRNMSTRAKPDGGAMSSVVERFVTQALTESRTSGEAVEDIIRRNLNELSELTGGYDFAEVITKYWQGHDSGNEQLKSDAVRWLRGEFTTRTDARIALGVRTIVDDANFYDQLKLLARFVRLAGFGGILICLDEMVNLYKLANSQARNSNYEQILRILNDSTQGSASGLGFIFGGTPDFLLDPRRGLYSYAALQSRLEENSYAVDGLVDYSGPVLRLASLTPEDFYVLLTKLRHVQAAGDESAYLISDEGIAEYMNHCAERIGDAYFRTPRNTIKGFLDLLAVLEQNPEQRWQDLLSGVTLERESNPDLAPLELPDHGGESAARNVAVPPATGSAGVQTQIPNPPNDAGDDDLSVFKL